MKKLLVLLIVLLLAISVISIGCNQKEETEETDQAKDTTDTKEEGGETMTDNTVFSVESPAFTNDGDIPAKYANTGVSGGENLSIPISWKNPPEGTKSFVIAMIDRHPMAGNWVHWAVINIPVDTTELPEGSSGTSDIPSGAVELNNTFGKRGYGGPQPPPGSGAHDYVTTVYALNIDNLGLSGDITDKELEKALQGKIISSAKLLGKFER